MRLDAGLVELLDHKSPARGGFQREGRLLALESRNSSAKALASCGADPAGFDLAGVDLYVVEGDLLPMYVKSAYNLHPWGLLKLRLFVTSARSHHIRA